MSSQNNQKEVEICKRCELPKIGNAQHTNIADCMPLLKGQYKKTVYYASDLVNHINGIMFNQIDLGVGLVVDAFVLCQETGMNARSFDAFFLAKLAECFIDRRIAVPDFLKEPIGEYIQSFCADTGFSPQRIMEIGLSAAYKEVADLEQLANQELEKQNKAKEVEVKSKLREVPKLVLPDTVKPAEIPNEDDLSELD